MARFSYLNKNELLAKGWTYDGITGIYTKRFPDMELYTVDTVIEASYIEFWYFSRWNPDGMYFKKEELYQWISPQQMAEFEKMYPDTVWMSYESALGLVRSQIGGTYDIDAILQYCHDDEQTRQVFRWILVVITAYNITAPSIKRSSTIEDNYKLAYHKLTELKNNTSIMGQSSYKEEPNSLPTIVSNRCKYLG